jgi:hypothetical protein
MRTSGRVGAGRPGGVSRYGVGVVVSQDAQAEAFGERIGEGAALAVPTPRGADAVGHGDVVSRTRWNSSSSSGSAPVGAGLSLSGCVPAGVACAARSIADASFPTTCLRGGTSSPVAACHEIVTSRNAWERAGMPLGPVLVRAVR